MAGSNLYDSLRRAEHDAHVPQQKMVDLRRSFDQPAHIHRRLSSLHCRKHKRSCSDHKASKKMAISSGGLRTALRIKNAEFLDVTQLQRLKMAGKSDTTCPQKGAAKIARLIAIRETGL